MNVDAALFSDIDRFSFAFVAQDHNGQLMEARTSCKYGFSEPRIAEAIGLKEALSWVGNCQHRK